MTSETVGMSIGYEADVHTALADTREGTILVRYPVGSATASVITIHAPGENRTGNNYLFSRGAVRMARSGFAVGTFDLSGFGESVGGHDVDTWQRQVRSAVAYLDERFGPTPVHLVARGASTALLPEDWSRGCRIAIGPPLPDELLALAASGVDGFVVGRHPCPDELVALWSAVGTEPAFVGGLRLETRLLRTLASLLDTPRWDVEISTPERPARVRSRILLPAGDLLVRHEMTRTGLFEVLTELVRTW